MCEIIFLGTGGGRVNLLAQIRKTGGFLVKSGSLLVSVDPGPGALSQMHELKINPQKINCVICTHAHIDHVLEAPLLIEAMSGYMLKTGGTLIAAKSVSEGDQNGDRSITLYHQSKLGQNIIFGAGGNKEIKLNGGSFSIAGVQVKHDDKTGFGFVMEIGGFKIGYTSDTEYLPHVHNKAFAGVDLLIANCLKPFADGIPDHLHSRDVASLLKEANPRACILSHLGMKLIRAGPESEAAKIQSASSIKTIAARDLYSYDLKSGKWARFAPAKKEEAGQKKL
ncbi:MAG: MBL fold metallo-hydrolase [Candidatus Micrarchaeota archaeon]